MRYTGKYLLIKKSTHALYIYTFKVHVMIILDIWYIGCFLVKDMQTPPPSKLAIFTWIWLLFFELWLILFLVTPESSIRKKNRSKMAKFTGKMRIALKRILPKPNFATFGGRGVVHVVNEEKHWDTNVCIDSIFKMYPIIHLEIYFFRYFETSSNIISVCAWIIWNFIFSIAFERKFIIDGILL